MFRPAERKLFQGVTPLLTATVTMLVVACGPLGVRNELRAQNVTAESINTFAKTDSLYLTIFDPVKSPGKGMGWKPFNRMRWFLGQRTTVDGDIPNGARMRAWEAEQSNRDRSRNLDESWTSIGPSNLAGRILCVAWDPVSTNILYAGSASGGLWKTTDNGTTWFPLTDNLPSLAIGTVVLDPSNRNTIYIGTGEGSWNSDAVYGAGIFKSTDAGASWTATGMSWQQSQYRTVNKIVVHPTNSQILWCATNIQGSGGVYKSTNGGSSWTRYLYGEAKDLDIDPANSNTLYTCLGYPYGDSGNGVYKSTDGGVTWTLSSSGLPSGSTMGRMELSVSLSSSQTLYLGIAKTLSAGAGLLGVYKSTNGGASWTLQASSPNFYSGQGWYNIVCEVHPTNPAIVFSSGLDLYRSTDSGVSWAQKTWWYYSAGHIQYAHADHHDLVFKPGDPNTIIAATDGGLYRSTDGGGIWLGINTGLVTYQYYAMGNDLLNPQVAFGGTQDNGTNKYANATQHIWVQGGDGGYCNVDHTNSAIVYATTQNGYHYKSTTSGSSGSFYGIQNGISGNGAWVTPRVMDPTNANVLWTGTKRVYRTTNGGSSWAAMSSDLSTQYISTIAVAPSNPAVVYVGCESNGQVWKTTDTGGSWSIANSGLPYRYITRVAVDPNDANTAYTTVSGYGTGHVYKTTNGGTSWSNFSTGLPDIPCNVIVVDPNSPNNLYVGTDLGVYSSTNGGSSWASYSNGLPNVVVDDMALHPTSGTLRVATHGRGMWETATAPPSLTVVSPNGGEQWIVGSVQNITWGTGGIGGSVSIELNRSYPGGSWEGINISTANDGSYSWTVTSPTTSAARIRITSLSQPTMTDVSNNDFSITSPQLTLSAPNGGQTWVAGTSQTISWTLSGTTGNVVVQINRSYPSGSWESVTTMVGSSYNWTVTSPASSTARVRVYLQAAPTIGDTSDANFTIVEPAVTVVSPNGGESLTPGSVTTLRWTRQYSTSTVKVELNRTYPSGTWEQISASLNSDSVMWAVDQSATTSARLRVTLNSYPTATDVSNANFTILTPSLAVTVPNGGEVFNPGSVHTIRWTKTNLAGSVNVYVNRTYSTGTWEPLAVSVMADTFAWSVTPPYSNAARIRVASATLPTFLDESNANFTIGTAIVVDAPNGGENWAVGLSQTVSWTRYNASGNATVQLNRTYPSGTWETLTTTASTSSYAWTVTAPTTSAARMRVFLTGTPSIGDTSNGSFTIPTAGLALTSPNGGELWTTGSSQTVSWTRNDANGNVSVLLNRSYPSGSWETLTTTVSGNSFAWTVSGANTSSARVKIQLTSSPEVNDISDANFSIGTPALNVITPAGGESWMVGSTQTIRWSREYAPGNVTVQINRYYPGGTWTTLTSSVAGDSLQWTVSSPSTSTNRIKVFLTGTPTVNATGAANFTIVTPQITVTAPNGGETWTIGNPYSVTFTRSNATGPATVQLNRSYPSGTWETITTTETGTSVPWTAVTPASSACRFRIFLTEIPAGGDTSNANFTVVGASLTITTPNGGENLIVGSPASIQWTRQSADGPATLAVNRNYPGGAWETITDTVTTSSYVWSATGPGTSTARMRVSLNSNPNIKDESNGGFTITQPALSLTSPDGGETVTLGGPLTVRWTRTAASGNVTVRLNRSYPGGAWETLTTSATADTFAWTATGAAATACRVKIQLTADTTISDLSASNFELVSRSVTLTSHDGGETYYTGSFSSVTFARTNATGNVTVQLNRNYPGGSWETLTTVASASSYSWSVGGSATQNARLRVFLTAESYVGDTSNANFAIAAPSLLVSLPNGGESWPISSAQTISWQRFGVTENVKVELNRSYPEGSWVSLSTSASGSSLPWTVSGPATDRARVRVTSTANSSICDTSNANFTIVQQSITLLTPQTGETLKIGFPHVIRWSRVSAPGNATVQVNRTWPSGSWETLGTTAADSLIWNVTSPVSNSARVRVALVSDPSLADTSDGNFTIFLPSLSLISPAGGERWRRNTPQTVSWTRSALTGAVRLELNSAYPGGMWNTLASGLTGNSYAWTITQAVTETARIRVVFESQTQFGDTSGGFAIVDPALAVTWPNGGQVLVIGDPYSLTFTRTGHPETVSLQLNRNYPTGTWETIAAGVSGSSVPWTASGILTFAARVRVVSDVYPGVENTGAGNFSILPTGITLISPLGSETFALGTNVRMKWARVNTGNVDVLLNRAYPSGTWETLAANLNSDSLDWTVSGLPSSACRIKVRATSDPGVSGQSAMNFEIELPTLTLVSPAAGDTFGLGVSNLIRWTRSTSATGNVRVELKRNYPSGTWTLLGTTLLDQLAWIADGAVTSTARIRIVSEVYPTVGDTLDFNLAIVNAALTVTAPVGGSIVVGQPVTIRWTRSNVGPGANVFLCRNYPGGTWVQLASSVTADEFVWTATAPRSGGACLRVLSTRIPALGDSSDPFSILEPSLTLLTLNGGAVGAGNSQEISWTRTDFAGPVDLDVNLDYPAGSWQSIAAGLSGDSYSWTVSSTLTNQARLRVRSQNPIVEDVTDANFSIVTPVLTVQYPNGGQIFMPGTPITISWTRTAVPGGVRVELNRTYPSGTWETIATDVMGNTAAYTMSGDFAHGRIRVSMMARPEVFDVSDSDFGTRLPDLYIVNPNGGDTLLLGQPYVIRWGRVNMPGLVKVELNRNYPGGTWEVLQVTTTADTLAWTISGAEATACRVRVTLIANPSITDISDGNFMIARQSVILATPVAGDSIAIGRPVTFTWATIGLPSTVNIYVKRNWPVGTWELVQLGATGGSYSWTASGTATDMARFRLLSATIPTIGDTTDGAVRIGTPQLDFVIPAVRDTFLVGENEVFSWIRRFAAGDIRVELSRSGETGPWEEIGVSSGSSQAWTVNGPPSTTARLRISLVDAAWVSRTTSFDCVIAQPALTVTSPAAGSINALGRALTIRWIRNAVSTPVDVFLRRIPGGDLETLASSVAGDSLVWITTTPAAAAARIVVRTSTGSVIEAESGAFALSQPVISFAAPLGGETFVEGEVMSVRWNRHAVTDPVHVQINRDYPAGAWTTIASGAVDTFVNWTVTGPTTYAARLRLVSTIAPALGDTLGENMTLLVPTLLWDGSARSDVTIGFLAELRWHRTAVEGPVNVRLSRDGGLSWPELVAGNLSDDFFEWIPTGPAAATARLKVESAANPSVNAVSEPFEILQPKIELMTPAGGGMYAIGSPIMIRWTRVNHPAPVNVLVSRQDPPGVWEEVALDLDSDSVAWNATPPAANSVRIRVVSSLNSTWQATSQPFSLQWAALAITSPPANAELIIGANVNAAWNRIAYDGPVRVLLRRAGSTTQTLSSGTSGNSLSFTVASPAAASCRIVVEDAVTGAPQDSVQLLGPFQPQLSITAPLPGTRWIVGESTMIRWSRDHTAGEATVTVNYNYPSGAWQAVETTSADSIQFLSSETTENLAVAVAVPEWNAADTVTGVRVVQPSLTLHTLGQSAYRLGTAMSIAWHNHEVNGFVRLELNRHYPSAAWETLYEGADTLFVWTASGDTTGRARLRVRSLLYDFAADTLGSDFVLYQPALSLGVVPVNDTLFIGEETTFILDIFGESALADIAILREPTASWETLFSGVGSGSYAWTVTAPEAEAARFRALVPGDTELDDTTGAVTILEPRIAFTSEMRTDYAAGDTLRAEWIALGTDGPFDLLLIRGEQPPETLMTEVGTTAYDWIVTPPRASEARLIVQDALATLSDTSETFTIHVPELIFISPGESGTDTVGSLLALEWEWIDGEGAVRLEVSFDSLTGIWQTLADSLDTTSFDFLVVGPETDSLRFRVRALDDTAVMAVSVPRRVVAPGLILNTQGGTIWYVGEQHWVRWSRTHYTGPVSVEMTAADRAQPWEMLANEVMSDSILWTVTGPEADLVALRVTATLQPELADTTDTPLQIALPRLEVVAPNGGDSLAVGENIRLRWRSEGVAGEIGIGLWRGAPVNRFDTLFVETENDSEEIWTITGPAAEGCYLIVVSLRDTTVWDTSNARFVILGGSAINNGFDVVPLEYSLSAPYPNPFNSTSQIEFALPRDSEVKIVIFDVLGREVAILADEMRRAGRHRVQWRADNAASGMYFARMISEDFVAVRKLQLLK